MNANDKYDWFPSGGCKIVKNDPPGPFVLKPYKDEARRKLFEDKLNQGYHLHWHATSQQTTRIHTPEEAVVCEKMGDQVSWEMPA